ncbi:MAG: SRPBCC family protein [Chloroflexi bacterium]|nr:SRPBCC family protein [Chloroflexota bacterium]
MPTIRETIRTELGAGEAFAFIADFANASAWDPGTATSERIGEGPIGIGARYSLGVRMRGKVVPMEYRIETFEPPRRVVLHGEGSGVTARDEITFNSDGTGARIDYVADIHLQGVLRLLEPFLGSAFARMGQQAREGMQQALDDRLTSSRLDTFASPTR